MFLYVVSDIVAVSCKDFSSEQRHGELRRNEIAEELHRIWAEGTVVSIEDRLDRCLQCGRQAALNKVPRLRHIVIVVVLGIERLANVRSHLDDPDVVAVLRQ